MYINTYPSDELYHHGIKGQKWGVRRFQNSDGSLTSAGKSRYGGEDGSLKSRVSGAASRATGAVKSKWNGLSDKQKKFIKGAAITAGVALAAYGTYKLSQVPAVRAGASKVGGALKKAGGTAVGKIGTKTQQLKNKASLAYGNTIGAGIENTRGFASGLKAGLKGRQANSTTDRGAIGAGIRLGNRTRNAANNARESVSNSRVANRARDAYYDMRDDANRRRAERALNKQLRSYSKNGK